MLCEIEIKNSLMTVPTVKRRLKQDEMPSCLVLRRSEFPAAGVRRGIAKKPHNISRHNSLILNLDAAAHMMGEGLDDEESCWRKVTLVALKPLLSLDKPDERGRWDSPIRWGKRIRRSPMITEGGRFSRVLYEFTLQHT